MKPGPSYQSFSIAVIDNNFLINSGVELLNQRHLYVCFFLFCTTFYLHFNGHEFLLEGHWTRSYTLMKKFAGLGRTEPKWVHMWGRFSFLLALKVSHFLIWQFFVLILQVIYFPDNGKLRREFFRDKNSFLANVRKYLPSFGIIYKPKKQYISLKCITKKPKYTVA